MDAAVGEVMSTMYAILHDDEAAELCRWQAERIAELERREALLMAAMMSSVELHRLPRVVNPTVATLAVDRFERALAVLTDAGFPWKDES